MNALPLTPGDRLLNSFDWADGLSGNEMIDTLLWLANHETRPVLPDGSINSIETFLKRNSMVRRAALAFLERLTWKESVELVKNDRKTAAAIADLVETTDPEIYREIAQLLDAAKLRMNMTLALCGDGKGVYKEVVRQKYREKH